MHKNRTAGFAIPVVFLLALAPVARATDAEYVGQLGTPNLRVEGVSAPSGTVLVSPSLVASAGDPGLVYLSNGRSLALAPDTEVSLEAMDKQAVQVAVNSGAAAYRTSAGEVLRVEAAGSVVLDQEGQIGTGMEVDARVATLAAAAAGGDELLTVDSVDAIDAGERVLLRSPDGAIQEIHCIDSLDPAGPTVDLSGELGVPFPAGTLLIQGDEVRAAIEAGEAVDVCAIIAGPREALGKALGSVVYGLVIGKLLGGDEEVSPSRPGAR